MSRIGLAPINILQGVEVTIDKKNVVSVKGPKGTLTQRVDPDLELKLEDGVLTVARPTDQKHHRAKHGLYRALMANMVKGVSEGFVIEQELVGVGYRATAKGQLLQLSLGYSHNITLALPDEHQRHGPAGEGEEPDRPPGKPRQAARGPGGGEDPFAAQAGTLQGQRCTLRR